MSTMGLAGPALTCRVGSGRRNLTVQTPSTENLHRYSPDYVTQMILGGLQYRAKVYMAYQTIILSWVDGPRLLLYIIWQLFEQSRRTGRVPEIIDGTGKSRSSRN